MKRIAFVLVAACAPGGSTPSTGNKPSCEAIAQACAAYTVESTNQGRACLKMGNDGSEAQCAEKLNACLAFCNLDAAAVVSHYGAIVHANYADAVTKAQELKAAVDTFLTTRDSVAFEAAKTAWLHSRDSYGESEVYRFYGGPIDDADGPEGRINAWPLDEAYIDYVVGDSNAGIINSNDPINKDAIAAANENGGEANIASGYHAVEFLLWGQDVSTTGPGARPHTDYVNGGSASNQPRRRDYLANVTELLVDDLVSVRDEWAPNNASNYRGKLQSEAARAALSKIITGLGSLARAELQGERMSVAYTDKAQEQEHSCFSDNTLNDFRANARGLENVYLGRYGSLDGAGLDTLVQARDAALDTRMKQHLTAALAAIEAIPAPFDQAILGADVDPGRVAIKDAMDALEAIAKDIDAIVVLLGLTVVQ